jgi:ADP-heptose:LPS heptosyltransferase
LEVAEGAGLSRDVVLAGRTDLVHLAALVAGAGRVVCGDTGVAHLATAFGTPSVVLFGPTSPGCWGPPPGRRDRHRALWAGGTGDPHGHVADPGLLDLTVADVVAALEVLPDRDTALAA